MAVIVKSSATTPYPTRAHEIRPCDVLRPIRRAKWLPRHGVTNPFAGRRHGQREDDESQPTPNCCGMPRAQPEQQASRGDDRQDRCHSEQFEYASPHPQMTRRLRGRKSPERLLLAEAV